MILLCRETDKLGDLIHNACLEILKNLLKGIRMNAKIYRNTENNDGSGTETFTSREMWGVELQFWN